MSLICVETSALGESRFWGLVKEMECSRELAIGVLACLWADSQQRKMVQGTKEEIMKLLTGDKEKLFTSLLTNDYLKRIDLHNYEISGNRKRLIETGEIKPADIPAKKITKKKEPGKSVPLWEAYKEEYSKRYHKDPPPAGVTGFSQLCTLIRDYGVEKAIEVIKHYFQMPDSYYLRTFHPIGILIKNRHTIYSSMTTGIHLTKAKVIQIDKSQQFQQTLMDIDSGVI